MRVAGIAGPGADDFAGRVVDALGQRGRVAWIRRTATSADGGSLVSSEAPHTSYVLDDESFQVRGPARSLTKVLDDLAPEHDYAIVTDHPDARIPHLVIGDGSFEGEVAARLAADQPSIEEAVTAIEASEPHETLESLVARATASSGTERAGAIATFTGRVRERDDPDDPKTTRLEFETYEGVAEERMASIAEELEERDGVFSVVMHHRTGVIEAGEDIVFVVVLAGHRTEAFETVSDGIDRLKAEVPIFKKEVTLEGEFWAHERE